MKLEELSKELSEEKKFKEEFENMYGNSELGDLSAQEKELALEYKKKNEELEKDLSIAKAVLQEDFTPQLKNLGLSLKDIVSIYRFFRTNSIKKSFVLDWKLSTLVAENKNLVKLVKELQQIIIQKNIEISLLYTEKNYTDILQRKLKQDLKFLKYFSEQLQNKFGENILTGLPTEQILKENLEQISKKNRSSIKVCYMDLTSFKNVNTVIHYENADKVLKIYGKALQDSIPNFLNKNKKIIPYHPHGDEYALVFKNLTENEIVEYTRKVEEIAQSKILKLTKELKEQKDENGKLVFPNLKGIYTNLSFGVTNFLEKDTIEILLLRANKLLDGVKYFQKGNIIFENTTIDNNNDDYHIHSGFTNLNKNVKNKNVVEKTKKEVEEYINKAEQKQEEVQKKEEDRIRKEKQEKQKDTVLWKKDYSQYKNLPQIIKNSLEEHLISANFSDDLKNLQKQNANKNIKDIIFTVEKYFGRKLTVIQKKIIKIAIKFLHNSLYEMIAKRDFLLKHGFSKKEVKILMRSGLMGITEELK